MQLGAVAALEAVEHAGLDITDDNSTRVSVMIASGIGGIITLSEQVGVLGSRGPSRISPFLVPMMLPDMASGQVSIMLGAKDPIILPSQPVPAAQIPLGRLWKCCRKATPT